MLNGRIQAVFYLNLKCASSTYLRDRVLQNTPEAALAPDLNKTLYHVKSMTFLEPDYSDLRKVQIGVENSEGVAVGPMSLS